MLRWIINWLLGDVLRWQEHLACEADHFQKHALHLLRGIMAKIDELNAKVDELQAALDEEQAQIAAVIQNLTDQIAALVAQQDAALQPIIDKLNVSLADLKSTIPDA